jgi:FkbM family methyltransferase
VPIFLRLAREARVFLDVGANTGAYTLLALTANPNARAVAFEPVPRILRRLRQNLEINDLIARCDLRAEAVSDQTGTARFHVPFGEVPSSASLNLEGFRGYDGELIDVPVSTVDGLFPHQTDIDLIKIDVEGFEDKALAGMTQLLRRCRPSLIIECNPDGPHRAVESLLKGLGYVFYHLCAGGAVKRDSLAPDASERERNYLCRPMEASPWK